MTDLSSMKQKDVELYFIQFLFCKNRELLLTEFRPLYDELFKKYTATYKDGREKHIDLMDIEKKFVKTL